MIIFKLNTTFKFVALIFACFTLLVEGIPFFQNRKHGLHPIAALPPIRIPQTQTSLESSTSLKPTTITTTPKLTTESLISIADSSDETEVEITTESEFDVIWKWLKNDLVSTAGTIVQATREVELPTQDLPLAISKVFQIGNETKVAFITTTTPVIETIQFEIANNTNMTILTYATELALNISQALTSAITTIENEDAMSNTSFCILDGNGKNGEIDLGDAYQLLFKFIQLHQPAVEENSFKDLFYSMLEMGDELMNWEFSTIFHLLFDFTPYDNFGEFFFNSNSRCQISPTKETFQIIETNIEDLLLNLSPDISPLLPLRLVLDKMTMFRRGIVDGTFRSSSNELQLSDHNETSETVKLWIEDLLGSHRLAVADYEDDSEPDEEGSEYFSNVTNSFVDRIESELVELATIINEGDENNYSNVEVGNVKDHFIVALGEICDNDSESLLCLVGNNQMDKLKSRLPIDGLKAFSDRQLTPLMLASYYGYGDIVDTLIETGVDINVVDQYGMNALFYAVLGGQMTITETLLSHNVKTDVEYNGMGIIELVETFNGVETKNQALELIREPVYNLDYAQLDHQPTVATFVPEYFVEQEVYILKPMADLEQQTEDYFEYDDVESSEAYFDDSYEYDY